VYIKSIGKNDVGGYGDEKGWKGADIAQGL
jgi:hypothetical protein